MRSWCSWVRNWCLWVRSCCLWVRYTLTLQPADLQELHGDPACRRSALAKKVLRSIGIAKHQKISERVSTFSGYAFNIATCRAMQDTQKCARIGLTASSVPADSKISNASSEHLPHNKRLHFRSFRTSCLKETFNSSLHTALSRPGHVSSHRANRCFTSRVYTMSYLMRDADACP